MSARLRARIKAIERTAPRRNFPISAPAAEAVPPTDPARVTAHLRTLIANGDNGPELLAQLPPGWIGLFRWEDSWRSVGLDEDELMTLASRLIDGYEGDDDEI